MAAAKCPILCFEKEKLLREFAHAVQDHHKIATAQMDAVVSGDGFQFEEELVQAAEDRERAKYAILTHELKHGC